MGADIIDKNPDSTEAISGNFDKNPAAHHCLSITCCIFSEAPQVF
jgi:hypothetical protein